MEKRLLEILCCPVTKVAMRSATRNELDAMNLAIATGAVHRVGGDGVTGMLSAALVTTDGLRVYRIEDGIPVLLGDEAISVDQMPGFLRDDATAHGM